MDNTLDYQYRYPASPVLRMRLKTKVPSPYDLVSGGTLNPSSLTHSFTGENLPFGGRRIVVKPFHHFRERGAHK